MRYRDVAQSRGRMHNCTEQVNKDKIRKIETEEEEGELTGITALLGHNQHQIATIIILQL